MAFMPIMLHALKGDNHKLEADFFNGYYEGNGVCYISATDSKENFQKPTASKNL